MAVAVVTSAANVETAGTSRSVSITVNSGEQLICVAAIPANGTGSSFQFNGVGMTTVASVPAKSGGGSLYVLYLESPSTGTNSFTWTASAGGEFGISYAITISGATTPNTDDEQTGNGANPIDLTATSTTNNGIYIITGAATRNGGGSDQTIGSATVLQRSESLGGSAEAIVGYGTYSAIGSVAAQYANGGTNSACAIEVLVAGANTAVSKLGLLGVG